MDQHSTFDCKPEQQYKETFMNKLYRWIFNHQQLTKIVLSVFLCGTYSGLLLWFHAPLWLIIVFDLFLLLGTQLAVNNAPLKLIKYTYDPLKNQCDPYPWLHVTKECLSKSKNEPLRQIFLMDHCAALAYIGEYEKAYELSKAINIDKYSSTLPPQKVIYYHNLASYCTELNNFEEADLWHQKAEQLYADITNPKQKESLKNTMQSGKAEACYRKKEYDQALEILENKIPKNKLESVNTAFSAARIYIAQNNVENAKAKLQYVIQNGNKLHSVMEARQLMEQL